MKKNYLTKTIDILTTIITILIIIFIIYGLKLGIFQDKNILINYIKGYGILAPLLFILIQIIQVIIPVIPGGASCLAGVLAFGSVFGFIFNYLGLITGSIIAFLLSRKYGISLIKKLFKEETINKYIKYLDNKNFQRIFFLTIFLPGLPDDIFCYISGLSKIKLKTYILIILLGKPLSILMYSLFIELIP